MALAERIGVATRSDMARDVAAGFEGALMTDEPDEGSARAVAERAARLKPIGDRPWGPTLGYARDLIGGLIERRSTAEGI